jgi:hypothetical protein
MSVPARLLEKKNIVIYDELYESRRRQAQFVLNMKKTRIECTVADETVFPIHVYEFNIDRCVKYNEADGTVESIHEPSAIWEVLQVNENLHTLTFF